MIRLSQAETAHPFTAGEFRQVLIALRLRAVGVNRVHNQTRLHAHHRPIPRINPFDFTCGETVADVIKASTTVTVYGRPQHAQSAHLGKQAAVYRLVAVCLENPRLQLLLAETANAIAD